MTEGRVAAVFTCAGAAVMAALTPQLDDHFVTRGAPLPLLCAALAVVAGVTAALPAGWARARAVAYGALATLRLAIPLLLTLAWRVDGRELWAALTVWVAVHDAWRGVVARAPMVPVAAAVAGVVGWTATTTAVAPGSAVLVGMVAGSAAAWASERRAG